MNDVIDGLDYTFFHRKHLWAYVRQSTAQTDWNDAVGAPYCLSLFEVEMNSATDSTLRLGAVQLSNGPPAEQPSRKRQLSMQDVLRRPGVK
jgi:hypothetical protein